MRSIVAWSHSLTRPQRRLVFGLPLAVSCGIVVLWLWLAARTTWFPGAGLMMKEYGLLHPAVTTTTQSATPGVPPTGPTPTIRTSSVSFDPLGMAIAALSSIALIALCIWSYRRLLRERALVGQCDQCGYDLRATPEPRCPECGAAVAANSARGERS